MRIRGTVLFMCISICGSLVGWAQQGSQERPDFGQREFGSVFIQGTVVNQQGAPIYMARISLSTLQSEVGQTAYSTEEGRFSFYDLKPGTYKVMISAPGYSPTTQEVNLISGSEFVRFILRTTDQPSNTTIAQPVSVVDLAIPAKAREHYLKGMEELQRNKPEKSTKHFQSAIKEHPLFDAAYSALGMAYVQMQKSNLARKMFEKTLQLNENSPTARLGMGMVCNDEKNFAAAETHLLKAQKLEATEWRVHYELGRAYYGLNKFEVAEKNLRQARTAQPNYGNIRLWLANALVMQNKYAEGLAEMEIFLELAPKSSLAPQVQEKVNLLKKELGRP